MNIMRAHFEKNYKEQAMEWFEEQGGLGGEGQAMEEMMQAMMMMGSPTPPLPCESNQSSCFRCPECLCQCARDDE